jgi:hypothetical protein
MRENPKEGEETHHNDVQSSSHAKPWRDPKLLEHLYWDRELSLREIGSKLGCDKSTVQRWAKRHGMELRLPNDKKMNPCISTNNGGYTYAKSSVGSDQYGVAIHQLTAILSGENPYEVFAENTHVHHHLSVPRSFEATQIDIPGNLTVMDSSEHQRKHQKETHSDPHLDDILTCS